MIIIINVVIFFIGAGCFEYSYMVEKNRKLQSQFDAEASSSSHSASTSGRLIFQGVSIFVDGFTIPSSQVCFLHRIVFLSYVWLQGDLSIKISKSKN